LTFFCAPLGSLLRNLRRAPPSLAGYIGYLAHAFCSSLTAGRFRPAASMLHFNASLRCRLRYPFRTCPATPHSLSRIVPGRVPFRLCSCQGSTMPLRRHLRADRAGPRIRTGRSIPDN